MLRTAVAEAMIAPVEWERRHGKARPGGTDDDSRVGAPRGERPSDCPLASCGAFGADGVVEVAGGGALFPTGAAAHDPAVYGGVPAGAGVGFFQPFELAWAGVVAEGSRGESCECPCVDGRLLEVPLGVSSRGVGGWDERASRPRGRWRSADGRLTLPLGIGSIIRSFEQSCTGAYALPRSAHSPWALILHAMRERHREQIVDWRTRAVRH